MATGHFRSISLPSRTHPAELDLKAELQALKAAHVDGASSPMTAAGSMRSSLCDIGEIYRRTDELLCLPGNQIALSHPTRRSLVERELDASLCLIDLVDAMRDQLGSAKEAVREVEMALRRKGDDAKIDLHRSSTKEKSEKKAINNCLRAMKRIECSSQHCGSSNVVVDANLQTLVESRAVAVSLLRSIVSLPLLVDSTYRTEQQINTACRKWQGLVTKALGRRKVAAFTENGGRKEPQMAAWTERNIDDVERGLECLYRRLIQNRVILLNLLSL